MKLPTMNIFDSFTPQVDELQRQLGGAEDEKKPLNQVSQFSTPDSQNPPDADPFIVITFHHSSHFHRDKQRFVFAAVANGNPPEAGPHPEVGGHRDD